MNHFPRHFSRNGKVPVEVRDVEPFTKGTHHISTKQVPTCLYVKNPGSSTTAMCKDILLNQGFTLRERKKGGKDWKILKPSPRYRARTVTTSSSGVLRQSKRKTHISQSSSSEDVIDFHPSTALTEHLGDEEIEPRTNVFNNPPSFYSRNEVKLCYTDPWLVQAGRVLSHIRGEDTELYTKVWPADVLRLQDPIPQRLFTESFGKTISNKVKFIDIGDTEEKINFLWKHTYWGDRLNTLAKSPSDSGINRWARLLRKRLRAFLSGKADPLWQSKVSNIYENPKQLRDRRSRSIRLLEVLKTVDGIFIQRYLAYPEEVWNWDRYDLFTLGNISFLITDEFLDGVLKPGMESHTTHYEELKRARKAFKLASHTGTSLNKSDLPAWLRQFFPLWEVAGSEIGHRRLEVIGILSQTRGAGTPPPFVLLKEKLKFIQTVTIPPEPLTKTERNLIIRSMDQICASLPDHIFTGLETKARVTVTTSACFEELKQDGGTLQHLAKVVGVLNYHKIPVRDLYGGRDIVWKEPHTMSDGEKIFWISLHIIFKTPREELLKSFLVVVKEPGKGRSVTKSIACLKVVLDMVNKLCSIPLKKGFESSTSGMSKAHHGWNFFKELFTEDFKDIVFNIHDRHEDVYAAYSQVREEYSNAFVSSTDYTTATDYLLHEVAEIIGNKWMIRCGIPPVLRGIVTSTCYRPRSIFFRAEGPLKDIGHKDPVTGNRCVQLVRGVLMGDPLTKIVLHFVNIVTRHIGNHASRHDFHINCFNKYQRIAKQVGRKMTGQSSRSVLRERSVSNLSEET
jgi:hypothetical protein